MPDMLFEIGLEEIPAPVVVTALEQLQQACAEGLAALRLSHGEIRVYGTPRRLAVVVGGVAERQPDEEREVKGPAAQVAFGPDGNPTPAARGFAQSRGLDVNDLRVQETEKGSFVFATVREEGRPAAEVIPGLLGEIMTGFTFPKTMKWGSVQERFCRPVRWLVALLGEQVLDFSFAGVQAGRTSRGHRFLGAAAVDIPAPAAYVETLRGEYVLADPQERQAVIAEKATAAAAQVGGRPRLDPELLTENTFLVEYPSCLLGSYSEHYLTLPERVPVTVMQKHQRYFPVEDEQGRLRPHFIIVRNGDEQGAEQVRRGNEKVIVPRLDDAEFYLTEDLKTPLPDRLEALGRVTYMEGLGTLLDKTRRLEAWVGWLTEQLAEVGEEDRAHALRAARLSRCDQVTLMVGDGKLAALQGYIGGHYARLAGEAEVVALALEEQYLPVRQGDPLPTTLAGRLLAVADRFDNLCAAFSLGMIPKGTRDPQGLRRQGQGLIYILLAGGLRLDLAAALAFGLGQLPQPDPAPKGALEPAAAAAALQEFFAGRAEAILQEEDIRYDVVRAALGSDWSDLVEAIERGQALSAIRASAADFETFVDTATRPANISRTAELPAEAKVEPTLFADDSERLVWATCQTVRTRLAGLRQRTPVDYGAMWVALGDLRQPIEALFNAVMINAEEPALRTNRLALMRELDGLYRHLADFTQVVQ
jgi:glycyl-tRNA synthetase beta chain